MRAWMGADIEGRQWLRFSNPASQPLGLNIIARDGHVPVDAKHFTNGINKNSYKHTHGDLSETWLQCR